MDISFRYTAREYTSGINQFQDNTKRIVFDLILSICLLIYGVYRINSSANVIFSVFLIVAALFYIFILILAKYIIPKLRFNREPKFQEEYFLSFQDEEINFIAGKLRSALSWDYYIDVKESKDFFFLVYGKNRYTIIPKRVFKDLDELNIFKDLVRSKINK